MIDKDLNIKEKIQLRSLCQDDILTIAQAFSAIGWNKPTSLYEEYFAEQHEGARETLTAWMEGAFTGYVTLKWESDCPPYKEAKIPEIKDLNVLPDFRHQGIGSMLLEKVEEIAFTRSNVVGLGVGLTADYQDAFKLYIRRGYLPDGKGLYHPGLQEGSARYGDRVVVDDDCTLWFHKRGTRAMQGICSDKKSTD